MSFLRIARTCLAASTLANSSNENRLRRFTAIEPARYFARCRRWRHSRHGLLFIRGLSRNAVDILCARYGAAISIINPGDAFIVGGRRPALDAIAEAARAANAQRVAFIQVMVASHTNLLRKAADDFRDVLLAAVCSPQSPGVRLLSGIDGTTVVDARTGLAKLARQVSQTVLWSECLSSCVEAGATSFLEFGPGRALSEMVASSYADLPSRSVDEFSSIAGVVNWIGSHGVP